MNNHARIEHHLDRLLASGEATVHYEDIITRKDVIDSMQLVGGSFMENALNLIAKSVNEHYKDEYYKDEY